MVDLILLTEVYEIHGDLKYTKLATYEKISMTVKYSLRNIYMNPSQVLMIKDDLHMKKELDKGFLPEGLDGTQEFTRIQVGCNSNYGALNLTVVGPMSVVTAKLTGKNNA
jgi:hypothetical protein